MDVMKRYIQDNNFLGILFLFILLGIIAIPIVFFIIRVIEWLTQLIVQ